MTIIIGAGAGRTGPSGARTHGAGDGSTGTSGAGTNGAGAS